MTEVFAHAPQSLERFADGFAQPLRSPVLHWPDEAGLTYPPLEASPHGNVPGLVSLWRSACRNSSRSSTRCADPQDHLQHQRDRERRASHQGERGVHQAQGHPGQCNSARPLPSGMTSQYPDEYSDSMGPRMLIKRMGRPEADDLSGRDQQRHRWI